MSFIPMSITSLWCPIMKRNGLLCELVFVLVERQTLIPRNCRKKRFSYDIKVSMSFIPIRGMNLWFPIMKRKEIIVWICVYPNWQINFDSKNGWKRSISCETKASMSFIPMSRMSLWSQSWKGRDYYVNQYLS